MDAPKIAGDSAEAVAYALFIFIKRIEFTADQKPTREWILETYKECMRAVR